MRHALLRTDLPRLWVPSSDDFFEIPELPVLGSGKLDLDRLKEVLAQPVIIDLRNVYERRILEREGFRYAGVGR